MFNPFNNTLKNYIPVSASFFIFDININVQIYFVSSFHCLYDKTSTAATLFFFWSIRLLHASTWQFIEGKGRSRWRKVECFSLSEAMKYENVFESFGWFFCTEISWSERRKEEKNIWWNIFVSLRRSNSAKFWACA